MAEPARQKCPNCARPVDVSVYVTGQRIRCQCGIHFQVQREETARRATPGRPLPAASGVSTRVAANPAVAPELAPTAVGRALQVPGYDLLEVLGRGGMGEVWRARQLSLGRTVALKILAPELAANDDFVRRFEKESAALATLSHPNIVQVIDRGRVEQTATWYFAMELCEGRSLRELLEANRLDWARGLKIVAQVARAMDYAHQRGIVHRDLKPENILVDDALQAKVVDFGLAGMRRPDAINLTQAATAMGTANYMAPEQRRDARAADERADIFSLGVILYEVLTGEVPFGKFKMPSARVAGLDPRLDKIVGKALDPEPDARYPNAGAMLAELDAILSKAPISAGGPAAAAEPARAPRSRRLWWFGMIGAALLAAALGLVCSTPPRPSSSAPGAARFDSPAQKP